MEDGDCFIGMEWGVKMEVVEVIVSDGRWGRMTKK